VVERTLAREPVPQFQLFDLETDPGETRDVIAAHPEVTERLKARLAQLIAAGRSRG
jgi:arylsulfatase A